jgi:hypothetical protein
MLALFFAAYLAAAPLDAPHAALLNLLSHGNDAAGCNATQLRKAVASAPVRKLGRAAGDDVVLAEVFDPCICGAQNCPFYVVRLSSGKPRVLLSGYAISVKMKPAAQLPTIVARMHDSAMVADESTYTYRDGAYVMTDSVRVRGDTEARKPNAVHSRAKLALHLVVPGADRFADVRPGEPYTLPKTGTYHLIVDNDSENEVPYALTLAIR